MRPLTLKEAEEILKRELDDDIAIRPNQAKDFQWGTLFYLQSKEFIENGQNPYIGISPRLVDKIDGSIHIIDYLGILDKQLEEYRKSKGYPKSIKFPVQVDLDELSDVEKVFALIDTKEFSQIARAIEMVKEKELFDLNGLKEVCYPDNELNLIESLAMGFPTTKGDYTFYKSKLNRVPKELALFEERITGIWITWCKFEEIPEVILSLQNLEYIIVENTPLKRMPYDLRELKKLREIVLMSTQIKVEEKIKFKLPDGCKIEIKNL